MRCARDWPPAAPLTRAIPAAVNLEPGASPPGTLQVTDAPLSDPGDTPMAEFIRTNAPSKTRCSKKPAPFSGQTRRTPRMPTARRHPEERDEREREDARKTAEVLRWGLPKL